MTHAEFAAAAARVPGLREQYPGMTLLVRAGDAYAVFPPGCVAAADLEHAVKTFLKAGNRVAIIEEEGGGR